MQAEEQNQVFTEWLNGHRGLLFRVVNAYAFGPADREDLFQEIATQVWRSIARFRGDCTVKTWIYRVALNTAIVWSKQESSHQKRRQILVGLEPVLVPSDSGTDDRLEWLYEQISQLDAIDRSIALLFLDGFSYKEMAGSLGISESNVGVRVHRIKSRLSQIWKEDERSGDR